MTVLPDGIRLGDIRRELHHLVAVAARAELAGRDLMCWCAADQPCHADVLLALANPASVPR